MRTPNFFILGAQKAGTTYLARVLSDHPAVFFSNPKETMFFSRKLSITAEDYERYCKTYFHQADGRKWIGEGSTTYLQWPGVDKKIKRFVGGAPQFIVCLRQPASKAVSFFIHNWRRGRYQPGATLMETLDYGIELSPLKTGLYAGALSRWLSRFPHENFLFMKFDDLLADPAMFVRKATDFLEIEVATDLPSEQINPGLPLIWDEGSLTVDKHEPPDVCSHSSKPRPRFWIEELETLQGMFSDDLRKTEELTGLDLSDWNELPAFSGPHDSVKGLSDRASPA